MFERTGASIELECQEGLLDLNLYWAHENIFLSDYRNLPSNDNHPDSTKFGEKYTPKHKIGLNNSPI